MVLRAHSLEQIVGGVAALLATMLSSTHICRHLRYNSTALQACTVRILAVVPIFALAAWTSLMVETSSKHWASPLSYVRELYESVAMLSFMQFVLTCLGGPMELAGALRRSGPDLVQHLGPLKHVLQAYRGGPEFVARVSIGILQYAITSICLFAINCLIWRPPWDPREPWFHESRTYVETATKLVKSASCGWAMYNLGLFYHQVHPQLVSIRPVLKFLSIKGVIFFTFWQGIVIFVVDRTGAIPHNPKDVRGRVWSEREISAGIQHFLLCLEMLIFAEMHRRAYPVPDPEEAGAAEGRQSRSSSLLELWREIRALRREAKRSYSDQWDSQELSQVVGQPVAPLAAHADAGDGG